MGRFHKIIHRFQTIPVKILIFTENFQKDDKNAETCWLVFMALYNFVKNHLKSNTFFGQAVKFQQDCQPYIDGLKFLCYNKNYTRGGVYFFVFPKSK